MRCIDEPTDSPFRVYISSKDFRVVRALMSVQSRLNTYSFA